jgi:guanylate kinase
MTYCGTLFIISAASGVGKTSLINTLLKAIDNLELSISYTTRDKRELEQHGVDYFFIDQELFLKMYDQQAFLESAEVFDNHYGTATKDIKSILAKGKDVILDIDWQGAAQIKEYIKTVNPGWQCVSIFVFPPSMQDISDRLIARNQDLLETVQKRLKSAKQEMRHYVEYDYIVINHNFQKAIQDLVTIIKAQRLTVIRQKIMYEDLINDLLS